MPAWEAQGPKKIAAVITYIRSAWGNTGGEITEAQVVAAKKKFADHPDNFTEAELKAISKDAKLEGGGSTAAAPTAPAGEKPVAPAPAPATAGTPAPAPAAGSFDLTASIESGKGIYMQTCFACHQATGMGVPGAFPPLAGTEFVNGDPRRLVAITLKGIGGALKVNGAVYATGMPSPEATYPILKDDKNLADVVNYIRNSFGNKNPQAVTPEFVGAVRKEFADKKDQWTEADLLNFPAAK
jgi:mono/diheme cytochrome c family protein